MAGSSNVHYESYIYYASVHIVITLLYELKK